MIEKLINVLKSDELDEMKELVQEHYHELGELVYGIAANGEYLEGPDNVNLHALIIKALSNAGHKLDYVDENGNSALLAAVKSQDKDLVMAFDGREELFTLANKDKITPISFAYTLENEEIKLFCTMKLGEHVNDIFPINGENMTYFSLAIFTSTPGICKAIALNEKFNYQIHKPYLTDIEWDDSEEDQEKQALLDLLESGKKFELEENEPYIEDDEKNELEQMRQGLSQLILAVAQNDIVKVRELINNGAKLNHRNTAGLTPLLTAVLNNNYEISKLLIENGAFVNCQLYNGLTPLLKAYTGENESIFDLLLENGVYIEEHIYNNIVNQMPKTEIQERMTNKIKEYINPRKIKQTFPYEYMYELGYNNTCEDDVYHNVQDVFAEQYGTNLINSHDYISPFGIAPVITHEHQESGNGLMTKGPSEYFNGVKLAILFKDGKVDSFDILNNIRTTIFTGENIIQIESTNYNIVALTKDGRVLIDNNKTEELEKVKTWTNIKKIATGNNSIFAITNDGEFKYAVSKIDNYLIEESLSPIIKETINNNLRFKDITAHNFNLGLITIEGKVKLIGKLSVADIKLVENITDAEQISANNHFAILRKNNTLFAFGNNSFNQCNVAKWHDIVKIQTTYFSTIGYTNDGEILCTECMFYNKRANNNANSGFIINSMLKPEGFGNLISMGTFVPDALQLTSEEVM